MPTTVATLEHLATPQPNMVAAMTGLTCIGRRYGNHLYTRLDALVLKVLPQLIERPTVRASSFKLATGLLIGSLPNASQVLNRNDGVEFLRLRDDLTADIVVEPGLKSPLSPPTAVARPVSPCGESFLCPSRPFVEAMPSLWRNGHTPD